MDWCRWFGCIRFRWWNGYLSFMLQRMNWILIPFWTLFKWIFRICFRIDRIYIKIKGFPLIFNVYTFWDEWRDMIFIEIILKPYLGHVIDAMYRMKLNGIDRFNLYSLSCKGSIFLLYRVSSSLFWWLLKFLSRRWGCIYEACLLWKNSRKMFLLSIIMKMWNEAGKVSKTMWYIWSIFVFRVVIFQEKLYFLGGF